MNTFNDAKTPEAPRRQLCFNCRGVRMFVSATLLHYVLCTLWNNCCDFFFSFIGRFYGNKNARTLVDSFFPSFMRTMVLVV